MITDAEKPVVSFKVGDRSQIIHLPTRNGSEIKIPALVREVLPNGYIVDTGFQQKIYVKLKDLRHDVS